jgi:hypothetical protein
MWPVASQPWERVQHNNLMSPVRGDIRIAIDHGLMSPLTGLGKYFPGRSYPRLAVGYTMSPLRGLASHNPTPNSQPA